MGHTSRGIAAGRNLAAVNVEYPHGGNGTGRHAMLRGLFDSQKLIAADADMRVADAHNVFPTEGPTVDAAIEDHEMIAQPVHLHEGPRGTDSGLL